MKKIILTYSVILFATSISFHAFSQESKKAADARKDIKEAKTDVKEAQADLVQAEKDSAANFKQFKKEALLTIAENNTKIAELKVKKSKDAKETQKSYDSKVAVLQDKNNGLKKRIDESNATAPGMWPSFKREFSHDMNELGHAIKDIGVNNKK